MGPTLSAGAPGVNPRAAPFADERPAYRCGRLTVGAVAGTQHRAGRSGWVSPFRSDANAIPPTINGSQNRMTRYASTAAAVAAAGAPYTISVPMRPPSM